MWSPSIPDLNPMDFCVWSLLETKACSVAHTSVPQEHCRAVVDEFQRRLYMIIDVKGGYIEK